MSNSSGLSLKNRRLRRYDKSYEFKTYILESYAAKYLWALGFRSIGFNVRVEPYGNFSVVGVKTKNKKEIAIVDCVTELKEYNTKVLCHIDLKEKRELLANKIIQKSKELLKLEQLIKVDVYEDPEFVEMVSQLNTLEKDIKLGGLYWHMLNTHVVANQHWVFLHDYVAKNAKFYPKGWGIVSLQLNMCRFDGRTSRKQKPTIIQDLSIDIDNSISKLQARISRKLTEQCVGLNKIKAKDVKKIFKIVRELEYDD